MTDTIDSGGIRVRLAAGDALIVVDVQNDFLPGGALAVPEGERVIPVLNGYMNLFVDHKLPIIATRDWHPADHVSFRAQGGRWPSHCVANTPGAAFAASLNLPADATIVSKATAAEQEAYSGFQGTDLAARLRSAGVRRVFIGGLATEYCVLATVADALREGFAVYLLTDAIRAIEARPGDARRAEEEMTSGGAKLLRRDEIE